MSEGAKLLRGCGVIVVLVLVVLAVHFADGLDGSYDVTVESILIGFSQLGKAIPTPHINLPTSTPRTP